MLALAIEAIDFGKSLSLELSRVPKSPARIIASI